jgi:CubicO group peptidase (beta-lactamase class C family)
MFEFERAIPEETGISSKRIRSILEELDRKEVPMHSLLIMKNDRLIFEKYYAPYEADTLHRMFSITKSFTALAIFLLAEEGKLSLDDRICDYFPEYTSENTHEYIRMMTIRNLLEMRTCHASTTYKVNMNSDWVESFFIVPPTHKPGTVFHYDTSAAHTLCALAEKLSGGDMLDYLKDRLLKHVDFSANSYLVKDPFGVSIGGSGLMATPMDILKVLYILDKEGTIRCSDGQVRTLLSKELIEEATSNISDTLMTGPLPSESQGYGMQIWRNEMGGFVLYGMGGQLAISIPSEDILVMTTADTQGMQGGNQVIYDAIYRNLTDIAFSHSDAYIAISHYDTNIAVSNKSID